MRQVQQIMGMPVTIDIPGADEPGIFQKVFDRLRHIDEKFSTYKPASEVSRFRAGVIKENDLSPEVKQVIKDCRAAEKWTKGYFSAWYDGKFDPSGYVKGWAVAEAGKIIENQGYGTYCISAGGDILARSADEKIWHIGIQDPADKGKILNKLSISNGAVCTSGSYERGTHIINPKTGRPAGGLLSVTVSGPDIITADILATACFAMGSRAADYLALQTDYHGFFVKRPGGFTPV